MTLKYEIRGTQVLMKKFRSLAGGRINKAVKLKVLRAAGKQLERDVKKNISLTDHSLQSLANLDHPYARRHGSIQIHQGKDYVIHRQSGNFLNSLTTKEKSSGEPTWTIGFKYGAARYFKYLITGTRVMLPRNVLYDTSQNERTRRDMVRAVNGVFESEIKKLMR